MDGRHLGDAGVGQIFEGLTSEKAGELVGVVFAGLFGAMRHESRDRCSARVPRRFWDSVERGWRVALHLPRLSVSEERAVRMCERLIMVLARSDGAGLACLQGLQFGVGVFAGGRIWRAAGYAESFEISWVSEDVELSEELLELLRRASLEVNGGSGYL